MTPRPHGDPVRYCHDPDEHGTPGQGCRCAPCTRAMTLARTRRKHKAAAEGPGTTDAAGTRRRLQALIAAGWPAQRLADRLGMEERHIRLILHGSPRVLTSTADRVRDLYDQLWDQPPPARTQWQRQAATLARNYAAARGWVTWHQWDDTPGPHCIDDPDAAPAPGWKREAAS